MTDYATSKLHRVYAARWIQTGDILYVGSSELPLERLEYNHRNWEELNYDGTDFRRFLDTVGYQFEFVTLLELECKGGVIELLEGDFIKKHEPALNNDTTPFETSWLTYKRFDAATAGDAVEAYNTLDIDV